MNVVNIDDLTIGQARVLAAQFATTAAPKNADRIDHGLQIAVLDRGFVYIGRVVTDDGWCYISGAWNIRRWGTTQGLGELVNGALPNTRLDRVGNVRVPLHALIHLIAVESEKWTSKLD